MNLRLYFNNLKKYYKDIFIYNMKIFCHIKNKYIINQLLFNFLLFEIIYR